MTKLRKLRSVAFAVLFLIAVAAAIFAFAGCNSNQNPDSQSVESSSQAEESSSAECTHEHTTTTSTATCTEGGIETVICTDCNEVLSTKEVSALGHNYEGVVTEATCTSQGYTTYTCSACHDSYIADYTQSGSHSYKAVVTAPTCTTQGYTTYTCEHCQDSYVADYVAATDHTWTGSTCEGQECSVCGAKIPATTAHNYVTHDHASCTESVEAEYECTICGDTYTQTLAATGHTLHEENGDVAWTESSTTLKSGTTCIYVVTYYTYCDECNEKVETTNEVYIHNYVLTVTKTATCTVSGTKEMKCADCGHVLENSAVSYLAEHVYSGSGTTNSDGSIVYSCTNDGCTNTKTVYTSESATVSTETLASDVELGSGTVISMSSDAVSGLSSSSDLTLAADSADKDSLSSDISLSDEELDRVGDSTIYSITLSDGNSNITNFDGKITVKLPYTLSGDEDEANITIFYISGTELVTIDAVYSDGYVVFETDHFSYYTVGRYTAAELCAKYGHNYNVMSKDATCTEDGYTLTVCTRCGESTYVKEAAKGHTYDQITDATCTANGSKTCSVCNHTEVIAAYGHTWVKTDDCVEATCQHAGHNTYKCSVCGEVYTQDLLQLSHNYVAVVTAPTCTAAGYTTYTCSLCGNSYVADYVAATGHNWNTDAACADRECLVCGTTMPATEEHTYAEGSTICTVCGGGCSHIYTQTVVDPTCTEYGYTKNVCSVCGSVIISDYVSPLGHAYTADITKCDHCGKANPELVSIFNSIMESCYGYEYTITLSDAEMNVTQAYAAYDESYTYTYTLESATLYITYQDGKIIIYGSGSAVYEYTDTEDGATYTDTYDASASIYGDGEYLYIYAKSNSEENLMRLSYEEVLGDYYTILSSDMSEYETMINGYLENELVQDWLTVMDGNSDAANELAAQMFYTIFSGKATDDGYEFTLNIELLADLNENLKTLTIAELVDEYCGEGTFSSLSTYIAGLENKTLYAVVTDILDYGTEYGVSTDMVFTTINTVISMYSGEEFDIESLLKDDSEESTVIGEMTIAEILSEYAGLEDYSYITGMLEEYGEVIVYDMLPAEVIDVIYSSVKALADSDIIAIKFFTDADLAVTAIKLVVDDGVFTQTIYNETVGSSETEEATVYSSFILNASGTLDVVYSCELPEGYAANKTDLEDLYSEILDTIKTVCKEGSFSANNGSFALAEDGTLAFMNKYSGSTITDFATVTEVNISLECETCGVYSVDIFSEDTSAYFYYNAKEGTLSQSFDTYYTAVLLEGSKTCEDGIEVQCHCKECGSVVYSYTSRSHYTYERESYEITSSAHSGTSYLIKRACACGESVYYNFNSGDGCYFSSSTYEDGVYVYHCAIDGCENYYTRSESYTQIGCTGYITYTYTYYGKDGTEVIATYTSTNTTDAHTYVEDSSTAYYTDEDGNNVSTKSYEWSKTCSVCGYCYGYAYTYDELGRTTSYISYEKTGSEYSYYHRYVYEFASDTSCECTVYCYNTYGSTTPYNTYTDTRHLNTTIYYENETCTQPYVYIYTCEICGENSHVEGWYVNRHNFVYDDELECYVCTECGLQSQQGANGTIIIEDFTESEAYGKTGYITIGYYDNYYYYSDCHTIMFTFVPVGSDGETDPEGETLVTIEYETYNVLDFSGIYLEDYGDLPDTVLQVSLDDIVAAAEAAGIDISEYDLRISFVPIYGDGLVCAITVTDLATLVAE